MPIRISREHKGDLLLECARLHYIDKLNKTDIAARLQISGTHVARLLREAEDAGIVEISVRLPADHDKLEAELQDRFGLLAVKVVDFSDDYDYAGPYVTIYTKDAKGRIITKNNELGFAYQCP